MDLDSAGVDGLRDQGVPIACSAMAAAPKVESAKADFV
jgi:hypothetical protein